ncbi:site-specific DNA-methyltransferase [Aequorivita marisscotiae]|uniref:site-specific DNA-methyltransferase (adenine-specific) n=1 Tax=Aequorivita marisscotiae TaxID=3040348 RepID=A0ABY8KPY5_9FLAO|nr:site-specific DNA-methyltransferase [Aequorivita sp. Ant34-E75]WGF91530.1 site-specific DNA-methyltransferase [Aequorivita sp. Ant34-E75]
MPTLNWIGKEKVVSHHQAVPYRVLEHKYGFTADPSTGSGQEQTEPTNSGNKIIHGDNLEALKSLLPEYEGKIKCIYIDPPYNTGNESWVYNDNVNHPKIKKWLGEVVGKDGEDLSRHDKWLCMMYPRLKLLHKLLDDNGAIFISIDDNEQANLKMICDEIFGIRNFVGTYFWYKSGTPPNLSHKIKRNIEYVLCYTKTLNSNKFQGVQKTSKSDDPITKPQNSFKELRFKPKSLNIGLKDRVIKKGIYGTAKFPNELLNDLIIKNGTNENEVTFKNRFIWVQNKLDEELENNTLVKINSKSLVISYKKQNYAKEVPPNFIDSSVGVDTTENAGRMLHEIFGKKVFDFPKTPSLIEYIINFLCNENDIILDSFAGSGTTAHAVLNLNKQDGGNRKFILVEMEDYANDITAERVKRVTKGYGSGNKKVEGTGGAFDFYELGLPLFDENQNLNEQVGLAKIREYIWFSETRTSLKEGLTAKAQSAQRINENYKLGVKDGTIYYFIYEKDRLTTLDFDALELIKTKGEQYVIYADNCLLPKDFMAKKNIIFKKIPRDITRF